MVKKIDSVFSEDYINEQGRKSKFIQRGSKMSAMKFLDLMLYNSSNDKCLSLNQLSIEASNGCGVKISKQGLDQRMNENAIGFLSLLLQKQLLSQISETLDFGLMKQFSRVRVKDSTKFDIHEQLRDWLPGFGGSASAASACIQYEFDLKSGRWLDLSLTPGNVPDSKDALTKYDDIQKGDLILRDLGYFSLEVLGETHKKGAYYLSRLNAKTIIHEPVGEVLIELDFGKLYQFMSKNGITRMEKNVFMGKDDKLPTRLFIELLPDEVYEKRVRKTMKFNRKKGHNTSSDYLDRSRFNLFVTNAGEDILCASSIPLFYKMRWQVELIFKVWKSTFGIEATRKMKFERFLCQLLAKLLLIMINWEIILAYRNGIYKKEGRFLSIDKCFKTLKSNAHLFRDIINKPDCTAKQLIQWIGRTFAEKHWLEKRNNKVCYEEIINLVL